ncbi:serine/threonine-protein phosphatase 6 regulatory ankyrin repeat subunit a-like isoform x2 [Plakobranchus ocellatus]|uniref:Serine/threonine-protein phosphatase 6 regulatory ankyrin repeat subunit a-like isoform x2 n=1 Tax=Plakobranchus ocellatus TaxID=259542 RepID=A0AAV4C3G2_9GAST|nr:serine/threonine-protein phosphatase 6 regulatory ankyrin repeat subunit a-like isoform x2 [Plakobranchus ocellatus]
MGKHDSDILTFVKLAQKGDGSRKLRGLIEHAPTEEIMAWRDSDGLDVMHNLILANNSEVVEFMLHRGSFVRPHQPEVLLYSTLAALLGERTVLQILLQYRPDDYFPSKIPMQFPESVKEKLMNRKDGKFSHTDVILKLIKLPEVSSTSSLSSIASSSSSSSSTTNAKSESSKRVSNIYESRSSPQQYQIECLSTLLENLRHLNLAGKTTSPLDVAARAGHTECVSVILNQCVLKRHADDALNDKSDVTLACVADNPQSLALLLHQKSPDKHSWEKAVEVCLHHAHPDCLDLLLQIPNRETKHMFKGMNFFHVLYTYTADHGARSYARLAQATEVLVRHGHDVGARTPSRTFPMYSLLTHAFCFHDYDNTQYYIKALRVLLKHGADPNHDEVKLEKRHPKVMAGRILGRAAFSSALHCLMETVETYSQYLQSPALAVKFVEDCAGVLMGNGKSCMNKVGFIGNTDKMTIQGSILHQLAKSSVMLGVNPAMIRCVLRHGADPNLKVEGKYAINVFFDRLFKKMTSLKVVDTNDKYMEDAMTICRLCMFMKYSAIRDCLDVFVKDHKQEMSSQVQHYVQAVTQELKRRSRQIHPLRDASAWAAWQACGCRFENVHMLKVPSEIKTYILPMAF